MDKHNIEISKIIAHLDQIERAEPSSKFLNSLEDIIDKEYQNTQIIDLRWISGIAASLLLILGINTYVLLEGHESSDTRVNVEYTQEYTLIPTQNLYHE